MLTALGVLYEELFFKGLAGDRRRGPVGSARVGRPACPPACDNGKQIDNSVCPKMSREGVEAVLQTVDANSVVWEWGDGPNAVYFGQCVKEWHIMISDPAKCRDIQDLSVPNVKVHCMGASQGNTADAYAGGIQKVGGKVDMVVVDGAFKSECLHGASTQLKSGGKAFVRAWDAQLRAEAKSAFEVEDVVGVDKIALLLLRGTKDAGGAQASLQRPKPPSRAHAKAQDVGDAGGDAGPPLEGDKLAGFVDQDGDDLQDQSWKEHRGGGGDGRGHQTTLMQTWQQNAAVLRWKHDVQRNVLTDPVPDKWGPREAYPCPDVCPGSSLPLENSACPMMWPAEAALLLKALRPDSVVFEWGSGMSSLYYSQCVRNWTSIEHHLPWCHEMQKLAPPNVRIRCIPIEAEYAKSFGNPGTWDGSKKEFKSYVEAASEVGSMPESADIVIIDGRARGDCSLEVLPFLKPSSRVFIHDWTDSRFGGTEQYDKSLQAYDIEDVVHIKPASSWRAPSGVFVRAVDCPSLPLPSLSLSLSLSLARARARALSLCVCTPTASHVTTIGALIQGS